VASYIFDWTDGKDSLILKNGDTIIDTIPNPDTVSTISFFILNEKGEETIMCGDDSLKINQNLVKCKEGKRYLVKLKPLKQIPPHISLQPRNKKSSI
jgi:hypothetical protein